MIDLDQLPTLGFGLWKIQRDHRGDRVSGDKSGVQAF